MEKVDLLWQQAFSKARLELRVFQLHEDALRVRHWVCRSTEGRSEPQVGSERVGVCVCSSRGRWRRFFKRNFNLTEWRFLKMQQKRECCSLSLRRPFTPLLWCCSSSYCTSMINECLAHIQLICFSCLNHKLLISPSPPGYGPLC